VSGAKAGFGWTSVAREPDAAAAAAVGRAEVSACSGDAVPRTETPERFRARSSGESATLRLGRFREPS
jgi:hypothetical protein